MPGGFRNCAALLCGCVAAVGMASCGDDDSAGKERPKYSAASEPPGTFATRIAKLLETTRARQDCPQLDAINGRSLARLPCPPGRGLSKSMARFEIIGAAEYGTGAIVEYKSGKASDGAAIVLFVGPDRNWAISRFGVVTEPSIRTSDKQSRAGFREAVDDYMTAVRKRDCKAFTAVAFTGADSLKKACRTAFPTTQGLAKRLRANPSASPKYEGGNATYGFFTLETRKPKPLNTTISVIATDAKSARPYVVLDVAESPTAKQQREAIEEVERSRKREPKQMPPTTRTASQ